MSLQDLGKNDVSEEVQAFKDKVASQETENAGLRNRLMRREAELQEIKASLDDTLHKLSKEADRVFHLENDLEHRTVELNNERISSRNAESALATAQEKLKSQERNTREVEAALDTISQHSQSTTMERQALEREKRALESRVRELEHVVHNHEAKATESLAPRRNPPRTRSSSASNSRQSALGQELNELKAQLVLKEKDIHVMENKLTRAQDALIKEENVRIAADKASQKRVSELLSILESKEEEIEALKSSTIDESAVEREAELLKRIDEDAAKMAALELLVSESQSNQITQAAYNKLQSRLTVEVDKSRLCEERQHELERAKEGLIEERDAMRYGMLKSNELLRTSETLVRDLEARQTELQSQLASLQAQAAHIGPCTPVITDAGMRSSSGTYIPPAACPAPQAPIESTLPPSLDESALANYIETLLQAIDRLRNERNELKRALEFSETEYRITTESFQARIATLSRTVSEPSSQVMVTSPVSQISDTHRLKYLTSCANAFSVVIANLQSRLEGTEGCLSTILLDLTSAECRLREALLLTERQQEAFDAVEQERRLLVCKLEALSRELSESGRNHSLPQIAGIEKKVAPLLECDPDSAFTHTGTQESLEVVEERLAALSRSYQDVESKHSSFCLQVSNLQNDFVAPQDELVDIQGHYTVSQSQQLSGMSTTDVTRALKDRIQELELQITQRSKEINDQQHDIRRLENNLRLQEERIAEMTPELDLLMAQKEAMVEDCAEAREARDEAMKKLETIEERVERLEDEKEQLKRQKEQTTSDLDRTTAHLTGLETMNATLSNELDCLKADRQSLLYQLSAAVTQFDSESTTWTSEVQQLVVALAILHRAWKASGNQLHPSCHDTASLQARPVALSQELDAKVASTTQEPMSAPQPALRTYPEIDVDKMHDELVILQSRVQDAATELSDVRAIINEHITAQDPERTGLRQGLTQCLRDGDSLQVPVRTMVEELSETRKMLREAETRHAEVEAELTKRVTAMSQRLGNQDEIEKDLLNAREQLVTQSELFKTELMDTKTKLAASEQNFADLEQLYQDVVEEFGKARDTLQLRLAETDERVRDLTADHQKSLVALETKFKHESDLLVSNLEDREHEVDELRCQLQEDSESRELLIRELESHKERLASADTLETELRQTLTDTQKQLEQGEVESLTLQEEKQSLQARITSLEAEIQRSISLTRYLESQVRESETTCATLRKSLEESKLGLAQSEKASKAAELSLALQATQHEKLVSALRRELASARSAPDLHPALVELEERNREMDDLLRAKCAEIEGYDDKILESLKVNKKLAAKVDSLTRKVQVLQAKLASMKSLAPEVPTRVGPVDPPAPPIMTLPVVVVPASRSDRLASGPSTIFRPKTPEVRQQAPVDVRSAHTPERQRDPFDPPAVSAGKKRRAPDDDERDSVPPEGRYSVLDSRSRNAATPRLRRTQNGFTPVRNTTSRSILGLPSPRRATAASHIISDVTNSPRAAQNDSQSAKNSKRSWLGKIRGGTVSEPPNVPHKT